MRSKVDSSCFEEMNICKKVALKESYQELICNNRP